MQFPFEKLFHSFLLNFMKNPVRCFSRFFYPLLILLSVIMISSSIFIVLGQMGFFQVLLSKAFIATGSRTISSLLIKMGFPGGLALAIALTLRTLISGTIITGEDRVVTKMASGPGSGEGSGEGTAGRSFRWTDLFGSSSTGNSEASVNQPDPASPNPGEPAAPIFPDFPDVYHPLQEDGHRRQELNDRLGINTIGRPLPDEVRESILETQFQMELKIEKALRSDRFTEDSIVSKRHQIRGILFYPNGRAFSLVTYKKHLHIMENHGTHRSLPYQRLMEAVSNKEIEL